MDRGRMRQRIARRPNAVRFAEARAVLEAYGWSLLRSSGSHHLFARGGERLTMPYRRPHILSTYVWQILTATEGQDDERDA